MIWPSTWIGSAAGFLIASIPGALLGGLLGQAIDRQLRLHSWSELFGGPALPPGTRLRFLLLGQLARCNGLMQAAHSQQLTEEMQRLTLSRQEQRSALRLFEHDRCAASLPGTLLRQVRDDRAEAQSLLLSCWRMAFATGLASHAERALILDWGRQLGWSDRQIENLTIGMSGIPLNAPAHPDSDFQAAINLLGVSTKSSPQAIRAAYRRLLSRHHPDKLEGSGANPEQLRIATETTRQLHAAYRLVRQRQGFD
jgi:DnaJ like chaperone protein